MSIPPYSGKLTSLQVMAGLIFTLFSLADAQLAEDNISLSPSDLVEKQVTADKFKEAANASSQEEPNRESTSTVDEGIKITVENSTNSAGKVGDAGDIRVYSPFPAKPMSAAPEGWRYEPAPQAFQAHAQTVKLSSGATIDLSITPFVLVPSSDGSNVFTIREPGFEPEMNFSQQHTIGAMLQASTEEIEKHEKAVAKAMTRLQQLLSSLPQNKQ